MKAKKWICLIVSLAVLFALSVSAFAATTMVSDDFEEVLTITTDEDDAIPANAVVVVSDEFDEVAILEVDDSITDDATEAEAESVVYDEEAVCVEGAEELEDAAAASVSASKSISLAIGNSWSKSFTTGDHNAFKFIVSGFSGDKYKVVIIGSNGYSYETSEHTSDCTITVTNAKASVTYTVYVINVGTERRTATVKLSSYYNS